MSTRTRVLAIIGVVVVVALGIWLATRGDDEPETDPTPTASATETASASPTPSASATASPTATASAAASATSTDAASTAPTASPTESPTSQPSSPDASAPRSGDLVVASDDGIKVVRDGTALPVPGVEGPIAIAFADRDAGILHQVDDTSIDRVADGTVTNVVDIADFSPIDPDGVSLTPHAITLMDVDAQDGLMVFSVEYRDGDTSTNADRTQSIVSATDGSGQQVVATDALFEGVVEHALGGGRRATVSAGEGQGALRVWEDDTEVALEWDTSWDDTEPDGNPALASPQLDDSGSRLAIATVDSAGTWRVEVVDTVSGSEQYSRDLDAGFIPLDLTDTSIVVLDTTAGNSIVLDLGSDEFQTVPGRATIAR